MLIGQRQLLAAFAPTDPSRRLRFLESRSRVADRIARALASGPRARRSWVLPTRPAERTASSSNGIGEGRKAGPVDPVSGRDPVSEARDGLPASFALPHSIELGIPAGYRFEPVARLPAGTDWRASPESDKTRLDETRFDKTLLDDSVDRLRFRIEPIGPVRFRRRVRRLGSRFLMSAGAFGPASPRPGPGVPDQRGAPDLREVLERGSSFRGPLQPSGETARLRSRTPRSPVSRDGRSPNASDPGVSDRVRPLPSNCPTRAADLSSAPSAATRAGSRMPASPSKPHPSSPIRLEQGRDLARRSASSGDLVSSDARTGGPSMDPASAARAGREARTRGARRITSITRSSLDLGGRRAPRDARRSEEPGAAGSLETALWVLGALAFALLL